MKEFYDLYNHTLNDKVIPFWLKYAIDGSGVINNCLAENGEILSMKVRLFRHMMWKMVMKVCWILIHTTKDSLPLISLCTVLLQSFILG